MTDLATLLKTAKSGDVITVTEPITRLDGLKFAAPGIRLVAGPGAIISPDPRSLWCSIAGCEGITLEGFPVRTLLGVNTGSSRIALESMDFSEGGRVQFRDGSDFSVSSSKFVAGGVSAMKVRGLKVLRNSFSECTADACQLVVYGDIIVDGNSFTDFRGEALHRDAIQIIAADATKPVFNVAIHNNRYVRGTGIPAQFIFVSDSASGYDGVIVTGNSAWGCAWHGVLLNKASNALIENNYLQGSTEPFGGQVLVPWIKTLAPGLNVIERDNLLPPPSPPGDVKALTTWLARNDDPRDARIKALEGALAASEASLAGVVAERDGLAAVVGAVRKAVQP